MRVHNRATIRAYADKHAGVRQQLYAWFAEAQRATWSSPDDIEKDFPHASIIDRERVVFNIKGNEYRLVAAIKYKYHVVYIRFIGTHSEYDKIDVSTI